VLVVAAMIFSLVAPFFMPRLGDGRNFGYWGPGHMFAGRGMWGGPGMLFMGFGRLIGPLAVIGLIVLVVVVVLTRRSPAPVPPPPAAPAQPAPATTPCTHCGQPLEAGWKACPYCGEKV
jgi:hypothetical protein